MLALQRCAGNAAVTRVLARDDAPNPFQLTPPTLAGPSSRFGPRRPGLLGDEHLHLDPEFELKFHLQALDAELQPDALRTLIAQ